MTTSTAVLLGVGALILAGGVYALTRPSGQNITIIRERDLSTPEQIANTFALAAGGVKDLSSAAFPWFRDDGGGGGATPTGSR